MRLLPEANACRVLFSRSTQYYNPSLFPPAATREASTHALCLRRRLTIAHDTIAHDTKPTTHILARAVVRAAGCVLLVRAEGAPHTFLPGGHREPGEGLAECLCRELREEIGAVATVDTYLGAVEHRWRRDDTPQYEINHCFATRLPALSPPTAPVSEEEYLSFEWVEIEQLEAAKLQPAPLRMLLARSAARPTPWWGSTLT